MYYLKYSLVTNSELFCQKCCAEFPIMILILIAYEMNVFFSQLGMGVFQTPCHSPFLCRVLTVHLVCTKKQMLRVYAGRGVTMVANTHVFWYRLFKHNETQSMNKLGFILKLY